ncbi:hypothetical protein AGLY_000483 [Aphis glycines]|uniref:Uncharacterized protein n=1 Tax=Aphis glycines TaxID=307491 RepID=A0A6G0U844_APHGL|nr:hypothetical protein AGLY_000483 [Aphis glycines]
MSPKQIDSLSNRISACVGTDHELSTIKDILNDIIQAVVLNFDKPFKLDSTMMLIRQYCIFIVYHTIYYISIKNNFKEIQLKNIKYKNICFNEKRDQLAFLLLRVLDDGGSYVFSLSFVCLFPYISENEYSGGSSCTKEVKDSEELVILNEESSSSSESLMTSSQLISPSGSLFSINTLENFYSLAQKKVSTYFACYHEGPINISVMVSTEVNIENVIQYISHIPYINVQLLLKQLE